MSERSDGPVRMLESMSSVSPSQSVKTDRCSENASHLVRTSLRSSQRSSTHLQTPVHLSPSASSWCSSSVYAELKQEIFADKLKKYESLKIICNYNRFSFALLTFRNHRVHKKGQSRERNAKIESLPDSELDSSTTTTMLWRLLTCSCCLSTSSRSSLQTITKYSVNRCLCVFYYNR